MKLDYVDLFYSHRYDPNTPIEETLQALVDIVRSGKALYIGISNWPLEPLRLAEQYLREHDVPLLIYQGKLNRLDHQPIEDGILDFCRQSGVGFIAFSPLAQGLLTNRYQDGIPTDSRMAKGKFLTPARLTPQVKQLVEQIEQEANAAGCTIAQRALQWVAEQPGVTSVLVGASSVEQLSDNLKALKV